MDSGKCIDYKLSEQSFGSFIFVIDGEIEIEHEALRKRDALGISDVDEFMIVAKSDSYILNIEVPGRN